MQYETTAAQAQAEAPTSNIARQVEKSAEQEKDVARQAALAAESIGLGQGSPSDELKQKTNQAVQEGQHDVEAAKAQGATYLEQAKNVAANVASTVQSYLPEQAQTAANASIQATKDLSNQVVDATQKYMSGDKS